MKAFRCDDCSVLYFFYLLFHRLLSPFYGHNGIKSMPVFSSTPISLFMFCTACPDAPFTKLSITETTVIRFVRSSYLIPISQKLEPDTSLVVGNTPTSRTRTK